MLKKLQNKKVLKKIWIVLAIIIVPAFAFWEIGGVLESRKKSGYIGKISGRKITSQEYQEALGASEMQLIMQFGEKYSEIKQHLNLEERAWEWLTLLHEAKKRKIKVNDAEVVEAIQDYPFFKTSKGGFDNRIYTEMLRYVFHTQPRAFEEQVRQQAMLGKLYTQVTDGVKLSDEETKDAYIKASEELSISYIAALPSEFEKNINPTEEEIKDYYTKNSAEFKQPLSFNLEYISEESEEKIKDISERIKKSEDFTKIAKDSGITIKETGFFAQTDPIPGIGWSPNLIESISKATNGQILPVAHIDKNYYLLKIKERKDAHIPDFEKVKDKAREKAIKDSSEKLAKEKIEKCLQGIDADFDKAAKLHGLKSDSTALFKFASYIEGIGASDTLWTTARELKEGQISKVIEMPSGYYIIKLKSRSPIDEKKFTDEKDEFSKKLLLQKKEESFAKFTEELKKK